MRSIDYKTVERWPAGHYNSHRNVIVRYRGKRFELESGFGSSDSVRVYREGSRIYVLSINRGLQYAGLAEYDLASDGATSCANNEPAALAPAAECFMDRDYDIVETFGKRGLDLSEVTIARRLTEYLPY
jgi:hypothetical protein